MSSGIGSNVIIVKCWNFLRDMVVDFIISHGFRPTLK